MIDSDKKNALSKNQLRASFGKSSIWRVLYVKCPYYHYNNTAALHLPRNLIKLKFNQEEKEQKRLRLGHAIYTTIRRVRTTVFVSVFYTIFSSRRCRRHLILSLFLCLLLRLRWRVQIQHGSGARRPFRGAPAVQLMVIFHRDDFQRKEGELGIRGV